MAKPAIRTRHDRRAAKAEPEATAGTATPIAPSSGFAEIPWALIEPDPLNPRKHFDEDTLNELATSILRDGLLENLVVRPLADGEAKHRLVAGERRWRAIGKLIERGVWSAPIMCKVVDLDEAGHRRVALVENLQRKDLRPIDEARALKELMALEELGTAEVALDIGFTQRFVQQRLQLLELPEKLQDQVNAGGLPIEKARTALAILPKLPPIKQVELQEGKITVEDAKAWVDSQPKPPELTPAQWVMALEIFDAVLRRPMKKASYEYDRTEVGVGAKADGHLEQLAARGLFGRAVDQQDKHYEKTGRVYVPFVWKTHDLIELKFADVRGGGDALQEALNGARWAADIPWYKPGCYHTEWLNPPFEVPELIAREYAAKLKKRQNAEAKERAAKAAQKAAEETRKAEAAVNAAKVQDILELLAARPPQACHAEFAEALDAVGWPAPWRIQGEGAQVVSATGGEILWRSWYVKDQPWILSQRALMVAAVNLAAGVVFSVEPDAPANDSDDGDNLDDQVDLEEAIADKARAEPVAP